MEENTDLMNHWTMPRKETQVKKMTVAGIESSSLCYGMTFGSSIDSRSTPYIELCWQNYYVVNTKRSHPTQLRCPQYFTCALFAFNTTAARLERSLLKNGARSRCIFGSPVARFKLEGPNGIHSLKLNNLLRLCDLHHHSKTRLVQKKHTTKMCLRQYTSICRDLCITCSPLLLLSAHLLELLSSADEHGDMMMQQRMAKLVDPSRFTCNALPYA